jgi:predicted TIM-barrel fold metal-dependent hydrolase
MEREVKGYGIDSWKWYCHTDPGRSGDGFKVDDEKLSYKFYEKSRELGLRVFSIHKGFASQSRTLGHLAHPGDVEKAALDHPDLTFVIYHSAIKHGTNEPQFKDPSFFDATTGDFAWHDALMKIKERHPEISNVYPEIGTSFGMLAIEHPVMAQHLIGKNIKYYGVDHVIWGTDCLWWGSPQWVIDAFKRFQISDELCDKFGYSKLTKEDKAKIFGLNAAKIYGVDVSEKRNALPADTLTRIKTAYLERGGLRDNAAYGWVRRQS